MCKHTHPPPSTSKPARPLLVFLNGAKIEKIRYTLHVIRYNRYGLHVTQDKIRAKNSSVNLCASVLKEIKQNENLICYFVFYSTQSHRVHRDSQRITVLKNYELKYNHSPLYSLFTIHISQINNSTNKQMKKPTQPSFVFLNGAKIEKIRYELHVIRYPLRTILSILSILSSLSPSAFTIHDSHFTIKNKQLN